MVTEAGVRQGRWLPTTAAAGSPFLLTEYDGNWHSGWEQGNRGDYILCVCNLGYMQLLYYLDLCSIS